MLHRDISINNLIVNEDRDNPSWPSYLIDLDLGIQLDWLSASGAKTKTGTRAFMAIGALDGELHSFMHDLQSFFWVLLWICIHYNSGGNGIALTRYDRRNYERDNKLFLLKKKALSMTRFLFLT